MKSGFTKSWRKELLSEIWAMPPIYHRIWFCLRQKAQHDTHLFPTPKGLGIWVLPGQRITSFQQIAQWVMWYEYGKEKMPNKKTVKTVVDYLQSQNMIAVESNAQGTLITIVNWDTYNNVKQQEGNTQETFTGTRTGHKKRMLKNEEEVKDLKTIVEQEPHDIASVIEYLNAKTGKSYKPASKANKTIIKARYDEGHTLEDFKSAIDNQVKAWMGTKFETYLRPSTLFLASKFEGYVNNTSAGVEFIEPEKKSNARRAIENLGHGDIFDGLGTRSDRQAVRDIDVTAIELLPEGRRYGEDS